MEPGPRGALMPTAERATAGAHMNDFSDRVGADRADGPPGRTARHPSRLRLGGVAVPADVIIEAQAVSKWFGGVRAVSDCSLTVARGSITGLIGPNGAGKTTLFDIIAGTRSPTAAASSSTART